VSPDTAQQPQQQPEEPVRVGIESPILDDLVCGYASLKAGTIRLQAAYAERVAERDQIGQIAQQREQECAALRTRIADLEARVAALTTEIVAVDVVKTDGASDKNGAQAVARPVKAG
jgi:uncharacterized protein involved in exopolysaccharide biosynthesis